MATGRNSKSKRDLKEALLGYLSADHSDESIENMRRSSSLEEIAAGYDFEILTHRQPFDEGDEERDRILKALSK